MKFSLSTNWCNQRIDSGEEIADKILALGFDGMELGFNTTQLQVKGFKQRLNELPVTSIHAFCPVPISAPQGYPELYPLASTDENSRAIARVHVRKNINFAAEMGAGVVVLHAGRVPCGGLFGSEMSRRIKRGLKLLDTFKHELEMLLPDLERGKVVLGLENLPYLEGYPAEWELKDVVGDYVRPWLDTGHDFVRQQKGWRKEPFPINPVGLHLNDSKGGDDHLPPGTGMVDFAAIRYFAETASDHLVLEPHSGVSETDLTASLNYLRQLWMGESK